MELTMTDKIGGEGEQECKMICDYVQQLFLKQERKKYFAHQFESFEYMTNKVVHFLESKDNPAHNIYPFIQKANGEFIKIGMRGVRITPPNFMGQPTTPDICIKKGLTYEAQVLCDKIELWLHDVSNKNGKLLGVYYENNNQPIEILKLPIMVRSSACALSNPNQQTFLDSNDLGGYFCILGNKKIVTPIERSTNNKMIIFKNKKGYEIVIQSQDFDPFYTNKNQFKIILKLDREGLYQQMIIDTSQFSTASEDTAQEDENDEEGEEDEEKGEDKEKDSKQKKQIDALLFLYAFGLQSDQQFFEMTHYNNEKVKNVLKVAITKFREDPNHANIFNQEDALKKLKEFKHKKVQQKNILQILQQDVLPHVGSLSEKSGMDIKTNFQQKIQFICLMIYKLLLVQTGQTSPKTRDDTSNKRVIPTGDLIFEQFETFYKKLMKELRKKLYRDQTLQEMTSQSIRRIMWQVLVSKNNISKELVQCIKTGKFNTMKGISKPHPESSIVTQASTLSQVSNAHVKIISVDMRFINNNQLGYFCPAETPIANIGLAKNFAITATITIGLQNFKLSNGTYIDYRIVVLDLIEKNLEQTACIRYNKDVVKSGYITVLVQGCFQFLCKDISKLYTFLRLKRFQGEIHRYVSFEWNLNEKEFYIYTDSGRTIRPLLTVNSKGGLNITWDQIKNVQTFDELITKYPFAIEFIDTQEASCSLIAPSYMELNQQRVRGEDSKKVTKIISAEQNNRYDTTFCQYSHCEIHKINVLGFISSNWPFNTSNYGIRIMFGFNQSRRVVQKYQSDIFLTHGIGYYLVNGEQPLVQTITSSFIGTQTNPYGYNIRVAVTSRGGLQQEDSLTISKSISPLFQQFKQDTKTITIPIDSKKMQTEMIMRPNPEQTDRMLNADFSKVDAQGYPKIGEFFYNGDVILARVRENTKQSGMQRKRYEDASIRYEGIVPCTVVDVQVQNTSQGQTILIKYQQPLYVQLGDKFASRHGQKGIIVYVHEEADMPIAEDGCPVDLICNNNSFPKRMTNAYPIELLISVLAILKFKPQDGTSFSNIDQIVQETQDEMHKKLGFARDSYRIQGQQKLYDPMTGKKIGLCTLGYLYYCPLEQKATAKSYQVPFENASISEITRMPRQGRKKQGGLRLGEMETDQLISCGQSSMINDLAMNYSDGCKVMICQCGRFADFNQDQQIYKCKHCTGKSKIYLTKIPYSQIYLNMLYNSLGFKRDLYVDTEEIIDPSRDNFH